MEKSFDEVVNELGIDSYDTIDNKFGIVMNGINDSMPKEEDYNLSPEKRTEMADKLADDIERYSSAVLKYLNEQAVKYMGIPNEYDKEKNEVIKKIKHLEEQAIEISSVFGERLENFEKSDQKNKGMTPEEGKELLELMKALEAAKAERMKAEMSLPKVKWREFNEQIEKSSAVYLANKATTRELVEEYKQKVATMRQTYEKMSEQVESTEESLEESLQNSRSELAEAKITLKELRKSSFIQNLEGIIKARERAESEVQKTNSPDARARYDTLLDMESRAYDDPEGKAYRDTMEKIHNSKNQIRRDKHDLKEIASYRADLDAAFEENLKEAKEALAMDKKNVLPAKQNVFLKFIGGIRAKLGIGKHKDEKNVADAVGKAMGALAAFSDKVNNGIKGKLSSFRDSIKDSIQVQKEKTIKGLENYIMKRIESEKNKTANIQSKINPTPNAR